MLPLVILLSAGLSAKARAQSVPAHCVGENLGNGQLGSCDPSEPSAPSPASGGPALNPVQQMQMNMALGAEQAVVNSFVQWLVSPAPQRGPSPGEIRQQRLERERQERLAEERRKQAELERRRKEAERARYESDHAELLAHVKDDTGDSILVEKDILSQPTLSGLQNSVRAIDCAMKDVYDAAVGLGPEGKAYADNIRRELLEREKGLPDGKSFAASWDSMAEGGEGGRQIVAKLLVSRRPNGDTAVDLMYHVSRAGGKAVEGQSVVHLDRLGGVDCMQTTGTAAQCMRSFNAKASRAYCPKEPAASPEPDHPLTLRDIKP